MPNMAAILQNINWDDLHVLLVFGESQGVKYAAESLNVDATTVARSLRKLEEKIGFPLTIHEGRRLRLNEAGQQVLVAAQNMNEAIGQLQRQLGAHEPRPEGVVRVTALRSIFNAIALPALPQLRRSYPGIVLTLLSDSRNLAIGKREADLAIRFARPAGADLATRKLFDVPFVVAGKDDSDWITYDESLSNVPEAQWVSTNVPTDRIILQANSIELILNAVKAGIGRAILPRFMCRDIKHGPDILSREAWLVMHMETRHTPRIRAVADWIVAASEKFEG
jgi:DNA-binding transcriptional LysR family regulator